MGHHLLLAPLVWLAVTTVSEDLRFGRIANRRLGIALGAGALAYLLLALLELGGGELWLRSGDIHASGPAGGWHWLAGVGLNLGVGLAVAILLWLFGVWAAGDAKLFAVYAFLVPPACYTRSYLPSFPALPLLVNVFALVFVLLAVELLRRIAPRALRALGDPGRRSELVRRLPAGARRVLPLLLAFTAMFAGIRALREASREALDPVLQVSDFTMFLLLFVFFRPLARVIVTRWGSVVFSVVAVGALVGLASRHGLGAIPGIVLPSAYAVVLLVFARVYPDLGAASRRSRVGDLREGMLLGRDSLTLLRTREQRELDERGDEAPGPDEEPPGTTPRPSRLGSLAADGLTAEQIRFIRTRYDDDQPIDVARTLPFSPLLAAGVVVTYLLGGPLTMFLTIG